MKRKICAMILAGVLAAGLAACGGAGASSSGTVSSSTESRHSDDSPADSKADSSKTDVSTDSSAPDPEKAAVRGSSLSAFTEVTSVEEKTGHRPRAWLLGAGRVADTASGGREHQRHLAS